MIAELVTLQDRLMEGILNILQNDANVLSHVGTKDFIVPTEAREHIPEVLGSTAVQVESAAIDYETSERSIYHEYPECITRIHCYKRIANWEPGITLKGKGVDEGLLNLSGAVVAALNNVPIERSHIACVVAVQATDPVIEVLNNEPIGAIACVTILFKHRFAINIQS